MKVFAVFLLFYLVPYIMHSSHLNKCRLGRRHESRGECHSVSVFPSGNLSAPGALLRPPALVTLTCDAVKVCGAGNIVLQTAIAGAVT